MGINIYLEPVKDRGFTIVKKSVIEGHGLFARKNIPKGSRILEYAGQRVMKKKLASDLVNGLTSLRYLMRLDDKTVIDAERNGNDSRFINHSCAPNCIVYFFNNTPYIYTLLEIKKDEELSFDYRMAIGNSKKELSRSQKKALMPCACGAKECRGTMLAN